MVFHRPQFPTSWRAWTAGIAGTLVIAALFALFRGHFPATVPALLMLIPISVASVMAGWRVGVTIGVFAGLVYCLAFIPPFGGIRIGLTEDVYVLVAFVGVAVFVGVLTGRRSPEDEALLDDDRAMLLRSVSHDLRTPLSTIHTVSTDLLDSDAYDPSTRRELMALVASESDRLNRIVANLLSISRVQAGSFQPALEPTAVDQIVDAAIARMSAVERDRIESRVDSTLSEVLADPVQIDQVLANLIENSLRHAPLDSAVTVDASREADVVRISVTDSGVGFSPEALSGLTGVSRPAGGGSGLGLTVCRAIVEAHAGEIRIERPATGARVSFTLRAAPPAVSDRSRLGNMAET